MCGGGGFGGRLRCGVAVVRGKDIEHGSGHDDER